MTSQLILHEGREKSLKRRHPWIFSKAVKEIRNAPQNGADIEILSSDGTYLATGSYSPNSQIRARVWTFDREQSVDHSFFVARISEAAKARELMLKETGMSACRLVDAESDGLPGLIIDRYNSFLVLEVLSAGAEYHLKDIVSALRELYPEYSIYERSDVDVRSKEGLEPRKGVIHGEEPPEELAITENGGMQILVNIPEGHKTGYYLDQRDNRAALAKYCCGKSVLNCFSYTGGFSLYALKGRARSVANVDVSQRALDIAKKNIVLNHLDPGRVKFIREDVFSFLRKEKKLGHTYDVIVLDPPKFAESRSQLEKACRGYKDINMIAASILNPGGYLMTYSCSGHMSPDLFQKVVADALLDAGREGQIVEFLTQASDHPVALPYPEALYLKGLVVRVR
ncbi:23S rRNA (cytosine1962-C5)-methyltransferase [Ruminobacter amylophilus]|uniref:23S rRNA (Cytosine1962-C5)-methyltransferase n=1 Tax=Ruminobacter amylophilus TaxID=867 RepID=A0A662ZIK6_9GAMM|nr:class I SAM-dependent methyltransferase [Ruminobacter amylophilus]SFP43618.1 23S rRNA (cytosine1962-C5)-methyltransferase [Ruminobacter amylophilus]